MFVTRAPCVQPPIIHHLISIYLTLQLHTQFGMMHLFLYHHISHTQSHYLIFIIPISLCIYVHFKNENKIETHEKQIR